MGNPESVCNQQCSGLGEQQFRVSPRTFKVSASSRTDTGTAYSSPPRALLLVIS